jgi:hypothetical protein
METTLKPCPFCNGEPWEGYHDYSYGDYVNCQNCGVEMPNQSRGADVAVRMWNTRAPTPREQELEAQNKALWELVVRFEAYIEMHYPETDGVEHLEEDDILAAIQEAKESHNGVSREKQK